METNITLKDLREKVLEKTGSETETRAFMKGFIETMLTKEAGLWSGLKSSYNGVTTNKGDPETRSMGLTMGEGFGKALGGGVANLGIGLGVLAAGKLIGSTQNLVLKARFMDSLKKARSMNKVVQGADAEKVMAFAETIFNFAPHVASDPNLLSTILANAIHGDGIDPMTIKTLTELEGRYNENYSFSPKGII